MKSYEIESRMTKRTNCGVANREPALNRVLPARAALLFGALLLGTLQTGCSNFGWPSSEGTCVQGDTFDVACGCTDGSSAETDYVQSCGFLNGAGHLATLSVACLGIQGLRNESDEGGSWLCEAVSDTHVSVNDCQVEPMCFESVTSLLVSSEPMMNFANSQATFIGTLDPSLSSVVLEFDGDSDSPAVSGSVFLTGGDCADEQCDITIDGLEVQLGNYEIHGYSGVETNLVTLARWPGRKFSDNTYSLTPDGPLKLAGTFDNKRGFALGAPIEDVGGVLRADASPLPGRPWELVPHLTIEGVFEFSGVEGSGTANIFLVFPFSGGTPRPIIETRYQNCSVFQQESCGWIYSGWSSRDFSNGPVTYRWTDAQGQLLSTASEIAAEDVYQAPSEPSPFPLTLTVTDAAGKTASVQTSPPLEPERDSVSAWVWASDPTATNYTAPTSYSHNSSGGLNTITRNGVGSYSVAISGFTSGNVQVSAYGSTSAHCKTSGWSTSAVRVLCFDENDIPVDSRFVVTKEQTTLVDGASSPNPTSAYLWSWALRGMTSPLPGWYQYSDAGRNASVASESTGNYLVTLPGQRGGGSVQVTAYGTDASQCRATSVAPSSNSTFVTVVCTLGGLNTDSRFTLNYTREPAHGAYARIQNRMTGPRIPATSQFNKLSTRLLTSSANGQYVNVTVPRDGYDNKETFQVTGANASCHPVSWSRGYAATTVKVGCYDNNGELISSDFDVRYLGYSGPI